MSVCSDYLTSSIGKKQLMALTGIGLLGFTATHLLGNLAILIGPDTFNGYAHKLTSTSLIYIAEVILASMFLGHILLAIVTRVENMQARPVRYFVKNRTGRGETIASMTMPLTGIIMLVFLVLHLINFKYGTYYETTVDGEVIRDLYRTVVEYFSNPLYVAWYVFAMFALGLHTAHGLQSSLQTLGANHPSYTPVFKIASGLYGIMVAFGFSALAIYCHFQN